MSFTSFSRRRLLASIAAAGGASRLGPFVPASVRAAEAPKRILTIFDPMGYLEKDFFPTGTGANFTLGPSLQALDPWKSKLTFLDGLALYGPQYYFNFSDNEHGLGAAMCFTGGKFSGGWSDSPSLDQTIADFQYNQVKTQFRSLSLGVNSNANSGHTAVFYSKGGTPVTPQKSPQATFDQLFKGFTGPTAPPSGGRQTTSPMTSPPAAVDTSARDRKQLREPFETYGWRRHGSLNNTEANWIAIGTSRGSGLGHRWVRQADPSVRSHRCIGARTNGPYRRSLRLRYDPHCLAAAWHL